MTKAEIVQALYARVGGFSKKESADVVDLIFEMMKETLARGEKIKISGFGNFVLRDKKQAPGAQSADRRADQDQRTARPHVQGEPNLEACVERPRGRGTGDHGDRRLSMGARARLPRTHRPFPARPRVRDARRPA
jgi:nucleoid DNA-binding protein